MEFEINLFTVALAATNLLVWITFVLSWIHTHCWRSNMQEHLDAMSQQLVAVGYGALGVGKSLLKLEKKSHERSRQILWGSEFCLLQRGLRPAGGGC